MASLNPTKEPVMAGATIAFVVTESVPFLNDVGAHISTTTENDLIRIIGVLLFLGAFLVRSQVLPVDKAQALVDRAFHQTPVPGATPPQVK